MKVLLISANKLRVPYPVYPLGLDHLTAAIAPPHQVSVLDLGPAGDNGPVAQAIAEHQPDIVGVSLRNVDNAEAGSPECFINNYIELCREIRRHTATPLLLGGPAFTLFPAEMMRRLGADWGVVGEGERAAALLDALQDGRDPRGLPGVVAAGEPPEAPRPWEGEVRRSLASIGQLGPTYLARGGMMSLQTKRGCPYRCSYCTYPHIEGHRLRRIPADRVATEAAGLQRAGARYLFVIDGTFNSDPQHNLAVARAFRDHGVTVPWGAFFTPLPMPPGYYDELRACGLSHVEFGTEALSDRVLRGFRKPFDVARALEAHQQAVDAGLNVGHYIMLGGPGETRDTVDRTLQRAAELDQAAVFVFSGVRIYPNTELLELARAEGQVTDETDLIRPRFYRPPGVEGLDLDEYARSWGVERRHWSVGSGGDDLRRLLTRMYQKGYSGPLWEMMIPRKPGTLRRWPKRDNR